MYYDSDEKRYHLEKCVLPAGEVAKRDAALMLKTHLFLYHPDVPIPIVIGIRLLVVPLWTLVADSIKQYVTNSTVSII
jgi:hypothetical protein